MPARQARRCRRDRNAVASSTAGVAQCIVTTAAKTIDIAVTAICAPISIRRASMMSVSAPAGRVRRNIGSVVATWTADTIIGSGLRLVISQFDEVSNIANPTFDAELAISMTVNAKLPKTPQRHPRLRARPTWRWTRWTTRSPLEEREIGRPIRCRNPQIKWRTTREVSRRRSAKSRPQQTGAAAQKVVCSEFARIRSAGRHLNWIRANSSALVCAGYWSRRSAPPRTRQISRACDSFRAEFRSRGRSRQVSRACDGLANGASAQPLREWAFGGVTQDLLARGERCTLVSH